MIQGIGTNLASLTVLLAAIIGANTFKGWRKQQFAARRAQEAEEILKAAYNARRAINQIRSPMMSGYELERAEEALRVNEKWDLELENRRKRLRTAQAYYHRLQHHQAAMEALDNTLPMARALFGEALEHSLESLRHQFWIVQINVDSYIDDNGSDANFTKEIMYGMYKVKDEENEVTITANAAVDIIEKICLPFLRLE